MVELDHSFSNGKPIEDNWETILDLESWSRASRAAA